MFSFTREKEELDQGSVLYGVRSDKYPDTCCYGIIISASCDVAQCKVPKFYYLIAVDAREWFLTEAGYGVLFESKINQMRKNLDDASLKCGLDNSVVVKLNEEEIRQVLESEVGNTKSRDELEKCYYNFNKYLTSNTTIESRRDIVKNEKKMVVKFLKNISKGEIFHFYYLPQDSYLGNGVKNTGLIVDFQEIEVLSLEDASNILTPGIDFMRLTLENDEKERQLRTQFWLQTNEDFVAIEGKIGSPWREHMMQRFSYAFTRIGLDGATDDDYIDLFNGI